MSRNPANRTVAGHIKEGFNQIPKTYKGLYNQSGPLGGAKTIPNNVRVIVKGNTAAGMPQKSAGLRAKLAAMGAASVTPAGPVAAFAIGVSKSVQAKAAAMASAKAPPAAPKPAPALKIKTPAAAAPKPPTAPGSPAATRGVIPKAGPKSNIKIGNARTPAAPKR